MAVKKKNVRRVVSPKPAPSAGLADSLLAVRDQLEVLALQVEDVVASHPASEPMPQELILAACYAEAAAKHAARLGSLAVGLAASVRGKGGYDKLAIPGHSLAVCEWRTTAGKRTPAWKLIASKAEKQLCDLRGEPFDEKRYQEQILEATQPGAPSEKPVFLFVE